MKPPLAFNKLAATVAAALWLVSFSPAAFGQGAVVSGGQPIPASAAMPPKDDDTVRMGEFKVTSATRSEKAVDHIPGAVNLITDLDIQQMQTVTEDVTKTLEQSLPGYSPSRQSLSVSGETLRGRTPLFLLDGIPQSTPLREGNREGSSFVDTSLIDRIEVIDGPSATEGLGAAGGIINFITKTPKKEGNEIALSTKASSQFDSNDLGWRAALNFSHKEDAFDILVGAAFVARPMDYDANGRLIGFDANGSAQDSMEHDLFIKLGRDFGANKAQRIQFSLNRYDLIGNGNYHEVDGARLTGSNSNSISGVTNTAARGGPLGKPSSNVMQAITFEYRNTDLFGGSLTAQFYHDREAILFNAAIDPSKQDPAIAPIGTLVDQSEVDSHKYGARTIFVRPNTVINGLEASIGLDFLHDQTLQDLALTNRTWVPPLHYTSTSPFAQLEYEKGPLTIRGGARNENGKLKVDTFTTIYIPSVANRFTVQGGSLSYTKTLYNIGAVYRLPAGWSVYVSDSEGYGVPDVGNALRGISVANQGVSNRGDLVAIVTTNHEAGFNWRGARGSFGAAFYESYSALGGALQFNAVTQQADLTRIPTDIKGVELTGEIKILQNLTFTGLFSNIHGKTAVAAGLPLDIHMGARTTSPTKLVGIVKWTISKDANFGLTTTDLLSRHINIGRKSATGGTLEENFHGYVLVDASFHYRTPWGVWGLGAENLLNKYYLPVIDSDSGVQTSNPPFFFAGRGRVVSLSDTIKF